MHPLCENKNLSRFIVKYLWNKFAICRGEPTFSRFLAINCTFRNISQWTANFAILRWPRLYVALVLYWRTVWASKFTLVMTINNNIGCSIYLRATCFQVRILREFHFRLIKRPQVQGLWKVLFTKINIWYNNIILLLHTNYY